VILAMNKVDCKWIRELKHAAWCTLWYVTY
jgi:hypothetical protein